jgi:hypothetical protein
MSKAGQRNFTGISAQADVALLYLLRSCNKSDFQRIVVEGEKWEDFTLIFDDHKEHFEVKWHTKPASYSLIRRVIEKELMKSCGENDRLKIVVKKVNKNFKLSYGYINEYSWLLWSFDEKDQNQSDVIKKFLHKNWREEAIRFLERTEVIELESDEYLSERISEYFAIEDPFYLNPDDQESIVAQSFREILRTGAKGGSIPRQEFLNTLDYFKDHIAGKSESFSPKLSIRNQVKNLSPFLQSEGRLKMLDDDKYLSPISKNRRLIFYITDKLRKSPFKVRAFEFFIEKILLKRNYVGLTMHLLAEKWKQQTVDDRYLLDFVTARYEKLLYNYNYHDALKIIEEIAENDSLGRYDEDILNFLKLKLLHPLTTRRTVRSKGQEENKWLEDVVAKILDILWKRTSDKKAFIDFIFNNFDLTRDDFSLVIETHPRIYGFVKDYIAQNPKDHFDVVIAKISNQFDTLYPGSYKGYDLFGSGISQSGTTYSITDKGIVRLLFKPLFSELYAKEPIGAWQFFKEKVLDKDQRQTTKENPIFLKRALINIILDRVADERLSKLQRDESLKYLKNIIEMKNGIPDTSEVIFDELRRRDIEKIGFENVMTLIHMDSVKYERKDNAGGYPTNLFVLATIFRLVKSKYQPAKEFFLNLVEKPEFPKKDEFYDSFELLSVSSITDTDPDFIVSILKRLDVESYLNSLKRPTVSDKSYILTGLIKKDWMDGTSRGKKIIDGILKRKSPSKVVLEFIGNPIHELAKHDALSTYKLFADYFKNKTIFRKTFKNNPFARQNVAWLAEALAMNKHFAEAKHIIELCIDDPDPETNNRHEDFNYHLKIKQGEDERLISTVRGVVPWALQQLVESNDPKLLKYALEKTEILLDLDGFLAKELNYPEPDYYVRLQAFVPLIPLAHPANRKLLNNFENGLGDRVKTLSFKILDVIEKDSTKPNVRPRAILKRLADLFYCIRDLTTAQAKRILDLFERQEEDEAYCLFLYFAVFREEHYEDIPFDPAYFKKKLKELCQSRNVFRHNIAWKFWRFADEEGLDNKKNFEKIEQYWMLLFDCYDEEVFYDLYRTLERTLTWPEKYDSHKVLLKKAIQKETDHRRNAKQPVQAWELGPKIFQILKDHDVADFLDVFYFLLERIDENAYYYGMNEWIAMFKSIYPIPKKQKDIYNKTKAKLLELYPEKFQS